MSVIFQTIFLRLKERLLLYLEGKIGIVFFYANVNSGTNVEIKYFVNCL